MACSLPQFILLKSMKNERYLRYRKEDDSKHAFLQFSEDPKEEKAEIQYVKFQVHKSETMEGYVHIQTLYNNKYWVRKSGEDESKSWIAAEANEPEEDPLKPGCTLFKAILVGDGEVEEEGAVAEDDKPQKIRLVHIDEVGQQGCVAPRDSDLLTLQGVGRHVADEDDVFIAYNATSTFVLPRRVALTNNEGKYCAWKTVKGETYVDFDTSDIGQEGVLMETVQVIVWQPSLLQFNYPWPLGSWRQVKGSNWITVATGSKSSYDMTPIMQGGNKIALQNRNEPARFTNRVAANGLKQMVGCLATSASADAIFGVEEPVRLRDISNVNYSLRNSRVYNIGQVDKFRDVRRNSTSVEQTGLFSVAYTISQTTNWSDSESVAKRVAASMSASVPFVGVSFGVEVSSETNRTVTFGEEKTETQTVTFQQNVTLPPRKQVTMLVVATRAQCDVPYTCDVVDTLVDGNIARYTKKDGLFTGANEFSFTTELLEQDI